MTALLWWFWHLPLLLPAKLLAVMSHETGHALATLLVGGKITGISIEAQEGGSCLSLLPDSLFARIAVASAGYLGSTCFAVALLWLTVRKNVGRKVLVGVAVWLAAIGLLYASGSFTLSFCLVMSLGFALLARFAPDFAVSTVNLALACMFSVYAAVDLRLDLWDSSVRRLSDAGILAQSTHVPSVVWATLWTLTAAAILLGGLYLLATAPLASPLAHAKRHKVSRA